MFRCQTASLWRQNPGNLRQFNSGVCLFILCRCCLSAFVWQETFPLNRKMDWQWQLTRMTTASDLDLWRLRYRVRQAPSNSQQLQCSTHSLHCWVPRLLIQCARMKWAERIRLNTQCSALFGRFAFTPLFNWNSSKFYGNGGIKGCSHLRNRGVYPNLGGVRV